MYIAKKSSRRSCGLLIVQGLVMHQWGQTPTPNVEEPVAENNVALFNNIQTLEKDLKF